MKQIKEIAKDLLIILFGLLGTIVLGGGFGAIMLLTLHALGIEFTFGAAMLIMAVSLIAANHTVLDLVRFTDEDED